MRVGERWSGMGVHEPAVRRIMRLAWSLVALTVVLAMFTGAMSAARAVAHWPAVPPSP